MSTILAITLLIFAAVTVIGSSLAVGRIGKPPTNFEGGRASFIVMYCTVEVMVLLLAARELLT